MAEKPRVLSNKDRALEKGSLVIGHLNPDQLPHFQRWKELSLHYGVPDVLFGWKRNRVVGGKQMPESRTVYFSADLEEENCEVKISHGFFFLDTRAKSDEIETLRVWGGQVMVDSKNYSGYSRLVINYGEPSKYDIATIKRRLKGKPRLAIHEPHIIPESHDYDLSAYAPFALCAGSGLSSESGLPLLGTLHNNFEVDNAETGELVFGAADGLPRRMALDPTGEFINFCQFTLDAIKAEPSESHRTLAGFYRKGIIKENQVFTDNMDDIFGKVDIPYIRTRQGIFPDRYPVQFDRNIKALVVIGVAVDRRGVVEQARAANLPIIIVNPVTDVAPHSRNMDYPEKGDIFFREKARDALPKIVAASGF